MSICLVHRTTDAEALILMIARVSSNQQNASVKLINYLIKNKHWSPFEHAHMTVEITTSRAISAQILRHRSFTFQEFSQRYAEPKRTVEVSARRQADKNRQSSINDLSDWTKEEFNLIQNQVKDFCFSQYERARRLGVAREQARFLLPLSAETKLYMTGNLRSWIHYIDLRDDEHAQQEHQEIAQSIKEIFCSEFPIISQALGWISATILEETSA